MTDDLVTWFREQIAEDRHAAEQARAHLAALPQQATGLQVMGVTVYEPARVLAECNAKERLLAEHEPTWQIVEWPHDQSGKGEAACCRRCQNAEHTEWHPPYGHADVLPDGFVAPYVLAPCQTLRILALPYADRPDYRDEWRPT